jgi:hypothetical protein
VYLLLASVQLFSGWLMCAKALRTVIMVAQSRLYGRQQRQRWEQNTQTDSSTGKRSQRPKLGVNARIPESAGNVSRRRQ